MQAPTVIGPIGKLPFPRYAKTKNASIRQKLLVDKTCQGMPPENTFEQNLTD